jgi:hypothetical protein
MLNDDIVIHSDGTVYYAAPIVKSLSITLVRDVDGKTFVKALDDVIARRIKKPTVEEESSLSTFRNTFLGRNLKQGTSIYLTSGCKWERTLRGTANPSPHNHVRGVLRQT